MTLFTVCAQSADFEVQCQVYLESPYDEMIAAHIRYMPQEIFNPPPQFSRLGTLCSTLLLFVSLDGVSFYLLVCYTYVFPCTCTMYVYIYTHIHIRMEDTPSEDGTIMSAECLAAGVLGQWLQEIVWMHLLVKRSLCSIPPPPPPPTHLPSLSSSYSPPLS